MALKYDTIIIGMKRNRRKFICSFLLFILIVCIDLIHGFFRSTVQKLIPQVDENTIFFGAHIFSLLILSCLSYSLFKHAISSISKLQLDMHVMLSITLLLGICLSIYNLSLQLTHQKVSLSLYSSAIAVVIFMDYLAKFLTYSRIISNRSFLKMNQGNIKTCGLLADQKFSSEILDAKHGEVYPIAYSEKCNRVANLIKLSTKGNIELEFFYKLTPIIAILSVVVFIVAILRTKNIFDALTSSLIFILISIPSFIAMSNSILLSRMNQRMNKAHLVICGQAALKKFKKTSCVFLNAQDLYSSKDISVHGIKAFKGTRVDKSLIAIYALLQKMNGPLKDVFSTIINCENENIPEISAVEYDEGKGVVGWVQGKRILAGNRELLKKYRISPPIHDVEKKYLDQDKQITYFAIGGQLTIMLILTYSANKSMLSEIKQLATSGTRMIVTTVDSNITLERITKDFKIKKSLIKILTPSQSEFALRQIRAQDTPDGYILMKEEKNKFITAINECKIMHLKILFSSILQFMAIFVGISISTFLILYSSLSYVGMFEVLIYILFWSITSFLIPSFIK